VLTQRTSYGSTDTEFADLLTVGRAHWRGGGTT
jgi:hypothetical protein